MNAATEALAAEAARLIADGGLDYASAKAKAMRALGAKRGEIPSDETVEDALREHIALFCGDAQPQELKLLRQVAGRWMERLAHHRPHLGGAVWRGTATQHSAVHIDLYVDDAKAMPIELLNQGLSFDVDAAGRRGDVTVLTVYDSVAGFQAPVPVHLFVNDADAVRGSLKPDSRGRTWRGALPALRLLLQAGASSAAGPAGASPASGAEP